MRDTPRDRQKRTAGYSEKRSSVHGLKKITSFANTKGSDLIIGIEEEDDTGEPERVPGVTVDDIDEEVGRLDSIIRDGVDPRIPSVRIKAIPLSNGNTACLVRVRPSLRRPHQVILGGHDQFHGRSANGQYRLDVDELQQQFLLGESVAEDIREFKLDRIAQIRANQIPIPLEGGARVVLHLIPYDAFSPGTTLEIVDIPESDAPGTFKRKIMQDGYRYNIDGIVSFWVSDPEKEQHSYTQTFRNGSIEAVNEFLLEPNEDTQNAKVVPSVALREYLEFSLENYLDS